MLRALIALGFIGLLADMTHASVIYSYMTDTPHVDVAPGSPVVISLFLEEKVSGGSTSLIAAEDGLFGAAVRISRSGAVPSSPTLVTGIAGAPAYAGGPSTPVFDSASASIIEGVPLSAVHGAGGADLGGGVRRALLGTLSLNAGNIVGETTTFTIAPLAINGNTLTFANGYDLDVTSAAPAFSGAVGADFTVTVVPEPATLALVVGTGLALVLRRRR